MSNTVANIAAGRPLATGGILRGALGATLPTTAIATPSGFTGVGYIGDAGVTESIGRSIEKIKAWGGDVVKIVQTEFSVTYQFTMIETLKESVNESVYGAANVTATAGAVGHGAQLAIAINSTTLDHNAWIFEVKDGDAKVRICVADGQVSNVGDITYNDGSVIAYPVTLECFPDGSGNQAYKYTDDGILVP